MHKIKSTPIRRKREEQFSNALTNHQREISSHNRMFLDFSLRLSSIEQFLMEEFEKFTPETHALRMMNLQDKSEGFLPTDTIENNDKVRLDLRFRLAEKEEFDEHDEKRRVEILHLGVGVNFPKEFELNLIDMKVGEEKSFKFVEPRLSDKKVFAWVKIITISRKEKPKVEVSE